jgi:hypothetical protein
MITGILKRNTSTLSRGLNLVKPLASSPIDPAYVSKFLNLRGSRVPFSIFFRDTAEGIEPIEHVSVDC